MDSLAEIVSVSLPFLAFSCCDCLDGDAKAVVVTNQWVGMLHKSQTLKVR
jgi:hypothetical protein